MAASGRLIGIVLLAAGAILGVGILAWLGFGLSEGTTRGSGAALGFILLFGAVVLPLLGGGAYFLTRGRAEARELAEVEEQRRLLDVVSTRGEVQIADLVLELNSTRDKVEDDLHALVGRGLFSGYVDWSKGTLYSVEASKLQGRQTCPNCGGQAPNNASSRSRLRATCRTNSRSSGASNRCCTRPAAARRRCFRRASASSSKRASCRRAR